MGEKNCLNWKQLWEDGNKLESRIIERMDKIEREKIFFGLKMLRMTTRNTTKNYLDTPEESKRRGWGNDEKNSIDLGEKHLTDDNSFLCPTWKRIWEASGKLEESGKILEKDLWVRAHSKETPLNNLKRDNAPVEIKDLNERTSSKDLERMHSGNTNLRDILSIPEQLNSEKWMNMRSIVKRRYLKREKGI